MGEGSATPGPLPHILLPLTLPGLGGFNLAHAAGLAALGARFRFAAGIYLTATLFAGEDCNAWPPG